MIDSFFSCIRGMLYVCFDRNVTDTAEHFFTARHNDVHAIVSVIPGCTC